MKEVSAFLIVFTLIAIMFIYHQSQYSNLTYVISSVDNNKYLVRNEEDKLDAANRLALLNIQILQFIDYLVEKHKGGDKYDDILQIKQNYNPNKLSENIKGGKDNTSYSLNKGEKVVLCIRQKEDDSFVDENTMMYVILHELAHIMSDSIGHTDEFWENFEFLLENAEDANIYIGVDYEKDNQRYCGMDITDNPLF
tara:strand:+ start:233 stop:820 length:588 start_codon:yes stop_codon:yes gene_type:complete